MFFGSVYSGSPGRMAAASHLGRGIEAVIEYLRGAGRPTSVKPLAHSRKAGRFPLVCLLRDGGQIWT